MDNRKWYNRFATIFWWGLSILPLIIALIYFIGYHLTFNSGITSASELASYQYNGYGDFNSYLYLVLYDSQYAFGNLSIDFLYSMFNDLFVLLGFGVDSDYVFILASLFSWMVSVQFYHLLFDFIVWLPQWFHRIMEKGMDKLS